ncbi:MAG TPA: hypothetical protein VFN09_07930 [Rhodanobacteraceae bacterium]|nr:hypothetical protein [Rhodanobacteraceae bacterium]
MKTPLACLLSLGCLLGLSPLANATTYTVGTGSGCLFADLRPALAAAAANPSGPHLIKVAKTVDKSLSYTWGTPDAGEFKIQDPLADITVTGGYASCTASDPGANAVTELNYLTAATDEDHTLLTISNAYENPRRSLRFSHILMNGSGSLSVAGPTYGGAILVTNHVTLELGEEVDIQYFDAHSGGGVALMGWFLFAPVPEVGKYPILHMTGASEISNGSAVNYGGGVYALIADVVLEGGRVNYNKARRAGGGIYVQGFDNTPTHYELTVLPDFFFNTVYANEAGMESAFTDTRGFGGGIYSSMADINVEYSYDHTTTFVSRNKANYGGGIYVDGPNEPAGGPFTFVRIRDTRFLDNLARDQGGAVYSNNAVDWYFTNSGVEEYDGKIGPRMSFVQNEAQSASADILGGGVAFVTDERDDGASRGVMRFYRTWFRENQVSNDGRTILVGTESAGDMYFERVIMDGNFKTGPGIGVLVRSGNNRDIDLLYSTVVNNDTPRVVEMYGNGDGTGSATLDLQGSILWNPLAVEVMSGPVGSTATHASCLIAAHPAGLPSGAWSLDPMLDDRYAPAGNSPAIDHCDKYLLTPPPDVTWNATPYDVPGMVERFQSSSFTPNTFDLGAIEQRDVIFANHFGARPTN